MKLHGYFRSSASYRVRIALNLKGLSADHLPHHLRKGEQCAPAYLAINPQGLVPTLENDAGAVITQSALSGRRLITSRASGKSKRAYSRTLSRTPSFIAG